jgi:hypothetical protein
MTISASLKKKHPRFFSERIHAPADSFISKNEGMNQGRDRSDPDLPARALRHLVPREGAGERRARG